MVSAGKDDMAWYRLAYRPAILQDLASLEPSMAQRLLDKTKWIASNIDNLRDRKSTRLNSSHIQKSRMPSSA